MGPTVLRQRPVFVVFPSGRRGARRCGAGSVEPVTVTRRDDHPELAGVLEVLVRPDGHVAWASRTGDVAERRAERERALTAWAGTPDGGILIPGSAPCPSDQSGSASAAIVRKAAVARRVTAAAYGMNAARSAWSVMRRITAISNVWVVR
ncbi:hypothetical protein [Streptomyces sp. DK15]|uniref:aromatic-ring hydroxylase C-terminal domain-containing protein n=1 Tax=Streptomyces sp. DK15 TaxID=2957499 RepID=UPI0030176131